MSKYPVAYRKRIEVGSPGEGGGFQNRLPRPANDNQLPANDNEPPRPKGPRHLAGLVKYARLVARLYRPIGLAMDVYEFLQENMPVRVTTAQASYLGYTKVCTNGTYPSPNWDGCNRGRTCEGIANSPNFSDWAEYAYVGNDMDGVLETPEVMIANAVNDFNETWRFNPYPIDDPRHYDPTWDKMRYVNRWERNAEGPYGVVRDAPAIVHRLRPSHDPFAPPGRVPAPRRWPYRALPHRRENPWRAPSEQTQRGPAPEMVRAPEVVHLPGLTVTPKHRLARPGRGNKEKKFIATVPLQHIVARIANGVTETKDFIDAIHDALPKQYQARAPNRGRWVRSEAPPQAKAAAIYTHINKIDWKEAWKNVLENQVEDMVIGKSNKAVAKTRKNNPYWTSPVGVGAGAL